MQMVVQDSKALYVVLDGVQTPVKPDSIMPSYGSRFGARRYTQDPRNGVVELDDSRTINRIAYQLKDARSDNYRSLADRQPLVRAGIVSSDEMRKTLKEFDFGVWEVFTTWGELVDIQPHLRNPNYKLPKGKNAFLYRGPWTVNENNVVDVTGLDPERNLVAVTLPQETGPITKDWMDVTGARANTRHYTVGKLFSDQHYIKRAKQHDNGLGSQFWDFKNEGGPILESLYSPTDYGFPIGGILVGSRLDIEEIIKNLKSVSV